jgi:hypothetical protein
MPPVELPWQKDFYLMEGKQQENRRHRKHASLVVSRRVFTTSALAISAVLVLPTVGAAHETAGRKVSNTANRSSAMTTKPAQYDVNT